MKRVLAAALCVMTILMALSGCGAEKVTKSETEEAVGAELVGLWSDSVEELSSTVFMEFFGDNTLVCSQEKKSGQVETLFTGNWTYDGNEITLYVVDSDNDEDALMVEGFVVSDMIYLEIEGISLSLARHNS